MTDQTLTATEPSTPPPTAGPPPRPSRQPVQGWPLGKVLVLALAMALLGGIAGWLIAQPDPPSESSVDVGFLRDMIDHHDQATYMAQITIGKPGIDNTVRAFAQEVMLTQRWEIGRMDTWLEEWGLLRGDPERMAMGWMGMPTKVSEMAGMQTDGQLDELLAASGQDADRLFLTMMKDHHQGGVHMAEHAARHADASKVRDLAETMANNQRIEIREYDQTAARLGLS